ncbi:hypothetical protein BBW65_01840 [Helicobacter enhydrae]|uniref:Biotin synthesis protein BioC n=1 Tax=Helicobacter enhydrae TaxID=222136 RepID=A0A1B1U4I2_9HELI|nr:methyltransferase domain-containing protein [Helicobacter enhydrae]ANV97622.1 hypothetical protein BBW65_01840 [Helicobacter enhydrae]
MRYFSFDQQAESYVSCALAQRVFAQTLVLEIAERLGRGFDRVADLGSGSGELQAIFNQEGIAYQEFEACDISSKMLHLYPKTHNTQVFCQDFDVFLQRGGDYDLVCSSSALQWARDLSMTLERISLQTQNVGLCIITDRTFGSLHRFLGTFSPLLSTHRVMELLERYFDGYMRIKCIELQMQDSREIMTHLRRSGVMGGGVLGYNQAKKMLQFQGSLEYEAVIFVGKSKNKETK